MLSPASNMILSGEERFSTKLHGLFTMKILPLVVLSSSPQNTGSLTLRQMSRQNTRNIFSNCQTSQM